MDIQKEKEAFNKEFGIDDADTFPAFSGGIENSAALKCNWLGWKKRAEFEYRENPETIEIDGLKTIHKLCKFADEHNMEGCSFTEIVERMFDELAKAQAVPEPTLDAPARVGGGIFQKGIKWSTVIGAAQRHYEHELREPIKPIISPADMLRIATGELVLVPIDTLKECLSWANVAKWDSPSKEVDREIAHHEGIIGAIIEAQEAT